MLRQSLASLSRAPDLSAAPGDCVPSVPLSVELMKCYRWGGGGGGGVGKEEAGRREPKLRTRDYAVAKCVPAQIPASFAPCVCMCVCVCVCVCSQHVDHRF